MSYHSVKSEDTNLASDDDSILYKDGSDIQQRSAWKFSKSRKPQLNTILQVLVVIETLVIIFLAATSMTTLRATLRQQEMLNAQYSTEDPHHLPTTYGRDRRYMTLDSKYDHLWKDWTADAQVAVPGELPGEDKIQAGYSMYDALHQGIRFYLVSPSLTVNSKVPPDALSRVHAPCDSSRTRRGRPWCRLL